MYLLKSIVPAATVARGLLSAALLAGLCVAAPAMADPLDGGWQGSPTRMNGQCFIMTTDHVSDDPSGMYTTSVNMGADDGQNIRLLLQWTQRQVQASPVIPKHAGVVFKLHFVSHDALGQAFDRGSYGFITRLNDPEQKQGLTAFAFIPVKLIVDMRNDAAFDVYLGSTLIRSVRLTGFHEALANLVACTKTPSS
jgi:hypothetical protein